jgi:hypothetical protein
MPYADLIQYTEQVQAQLAEYRGWVRSRVGPTAPNVSLDEVARRVGEALDLRHGLSVVRNGDGEGACLFQCSDLDLPDLKRAVMARTLGLHFGQPDYRTEDFEFWGTTMRRALLAADITTPARTDAVMARYVDAETPDFRGYVGSTYGNAFVAANRGALGAVYEDGYLHRAFLPRYREIFSGRDIVLVSPHDVAVAFARHFGCNVVATVSIPNQAVNLKGKFTTQLYPDLYEVKRQEIIGHSLPGRLVVVAAGLAAKPYCVDAAGAGAVALDVGSMMDVWAGIGVRGYQTDEFVAQHRL